MPVEDPPKDGPTHRPLPSVDMPLLRGQVRRSRMQRAIVRGLLAVALLGAGALYLWLSQPADDEDPLLPAAAIAPPADDAGAPDAAPRATAPRQPPVILAAAAPAAEAIPGAIVTTGAVSRSVAAFGTARGFRPALLQAGVDPGECASLEAALQNVLDFRRCRPEDRMVLERDVDGHLVRFEYHAIPTEYVVMTRDSAGAMRGEKVQVPIERIPVARGGVVRTSLGDALEQAGFGRSLAGLFVEVFETKASFAADARTGDTFRVVVDEERIHGEFFRWGTVRALEYAGTRTGTLRGFYFEAGGEGDYYDPDGRSLHGSWLRTPVRYDRISSRFDLRRRHPILRRIVPHTGVDYAAATGTQVVAGAAGTVTWAGAKGPNGNLVAIRHANGYESFYAHLSQINRGITRGAEIRQRQPIGTVGSTGRSTGPHLHFGLKHMGRFVDPLAVILGPGHLLPAGPMTAFRREMHALERRLLAIDVRPLPAVLATDLPERTEDDEAPMD